MHFEREAYNMNCERCVYCQYPRKADDNNGLCKCKLMQRKTIDVYVGGGECPKWCPLKNDGTENLKANSSIESMRKRAKMSRKEFAEFFNIPYRTIQNWELGQRLCPAYIVYLMEYKLVKEGLI